MGTMFAPSLDHPRVLRENGYCLCVGENLLPHGQWLFLPPLEVRKDDVCDLFGLFGGVFRGDNLGVLILVVYDGYTTTKVENPALDVHERSFGDQM